MSEDLDLDSAERPLKGAFAVTADGSRQLPVAAVEVRSGVDDGLALALGQKIFVGQAVRVSYTDPTAGNDTRALQDTDGNDAASFDRAVTNNSVQFSGPPAQVTGLMLTTTPRSGQIRAMWDRPARAAGYRVEWKSGSQGYTGARSTTLSRASATSTTLTGLAVDVTYTVRVIATNAIGDGPPSAEARATTRRSIRLPEPESVEVESGGDEIIVTFATEFARRPLPFLEDFTLLADGVAVPLSSVATCRARSLVNQPCDTTYNPHRPNPSDKVRLRTDWYRLVKGERAVERYRIRTGAPVTLSYADFENVAAANNSTHAPTKPYHPRNVEAVARGAHRIDVSWSAPAFNGGRAITTYRVEASPDGSTDWATVGETESGDVTSFRHTGLAEGTTFHYRIRGINSEGAGAHSYLDREDASATTAADSTPPELTDASVALEDLISVYYDEPLWQLESGLPRVGSFTVKVDGQTVPVTRVHRRPFTSWLGVWLFLDGTIEAGQAVTLSYRDPTGGNDAQALQDSAGNDAASFTDHAVTNSLRGTTGGVQNAEPETDPLTVSVASAPERHDGESGFEVRLAFSEAPGTLSFRTVRDHAFTVSGGSVRHARRVVQGSNRQWEVGVEPSGEGDVTLTLAPSPACGEAHADMHRGRAPLETGLAVTVPGPEAEALVLLEGFFATRRRSTTGRRRSRCASRSASRCPRCGGRCATTWCGSRAGRRRARGGSTGERTCGTSPSSPRGSRRRR